MSLPIRPPVIYRQCHNAIAIHSYLQLARQQRAQQAAKYWRNRLQCLRNLKRKLF